MAAAELTSIEPLRPLLTRQPFAILSDIDGTIAPIVANPADARVTDCAREALTKLHERGVLIGFITGRSLPMAQRIVDVPGAYFAANHGIDILANGVTGTPDNIAPYVEWAQKVLEEVGDLHVPGLAVEDKGPVVAFHYRNTRSEEEALAAIHAGLARSETAKHFRELQGRKVLELRPPLGIDKGTAVEALTGLMGARSVLCLGDDATDMDMFQGVLELRSRNIPGASVAAWSPEVPPEVLEATDYFVRGVEGVEWLLEELLKALPRPSAAKGP